MNSEVQSEGDSTTLFKEGDSSILSQEGGPSVVTKYKLNPSSEIFPSYFQLISKSPPISTLPSALYCGNSCDLWKFFSFNLKSYRTILGQKDFRIMKILIYYSLMAFLERSILRIPECQQKSTLRKKFKQLKQFLARQKQQENGLKNKLQDGLQKNQHDFCKYLKNLKVLDFSLENLGIVLDQLEADPNSPKSKQLLEAVVKYILKKQSSRNHESVEGKKREAMMKLLGLHLIFVLHNQKWTTISLSEKISATMKICLLSEPNGTNKLIKFYTDAPESVLDEEHRSFYKAVFID